MLKRSALVEAVRRACMCLEGGKREERRVFSDQWRNQHTYLSQLSDVKNSKADRGGSGQWGAVELTPQDVERNGHPETRVLTPQVWSPFTTVSFKE